VQATSSTDSGSLTKNIAPWMRSDRKFLAFPMPKINRGRNVNLLLRTRPVADSASRALS
jgi:hypothetical protein